MWWNKKEEPKREYEKTQLEVKLYSRKEEFTFSYGGFKDENYKEDPFYKHNEEEADRLLKWWESSSKETFVIKTHGGSRLAFERKNVEYIWKKTPTVFLR